MDATLTIMGRPRKAEKTVQVRISATAWRKARAIAGALGVDLPDWLSPIIEKAADEQKPLIDEMWKRKPPRKPDG